MNVGGRSSITIDPQLPQRSTDRLASRTRSTDGWKTQVQTSPSAAARSLVLICPPAVTRSCRTETLQQEADVRSYNVKTPAGRFVPLKSEPNRMTIVTGMVRTRDLRA